MSGNVKKNNNQKQKNTTNSKSAKQSDTKSSKTLSDKITAIVMTFIYILAVVSVGVIGYSLYYFLNDPPETTTTGYVDSLTYAPDETYPIEVSVYSNDKHNGIKVSELRLNYYTDTDIPTSDADIDNIKQDNNYNNSEILEDLFKVIYSSGIQFVDEVKFNKVEQTGGWFEAAMYWNMEPENAFFYNTTNGTSYDAINELDYLDKWIIDFGEGVLGRIEQDKGNVVVDKVVWSLRYMRYDIMLFIQDVFQSVESLDYGKQVLMFDLSDYFTFRIFSTEDMKFHVPETDDLNLFVNILVNKSENGMINSSQSLFGCVSNNSNWSYDHVDSEDYWTSHTAINLSQADFAVSDSLLSLDSSAIDYYSTFDPEILDITVYIDLTQTTGTGVTLDAFGDLLVDRIVVSSNYPTTFTYYNLPENCVIVANDNVTLEVIT